MFADRIDNRRAHSALARAPWAAGVLRCSSALMALAALGCGSAALADTAATATAPAPADGLGDIVVTAEHVKNNAQTTAIALSVIKGDDLKAAGIADLSALSAMAPDLGFAQTEGKPMITIRGISSRDTTEVGDPAVTVSTDGFYLNRPYSLNATMYDIDRVEILRGPQGTLNGRNSVGGAINIITAHPTDHYEGYASLEYGNYNTLVAQGAINIPLSDAVQVRGSFYTSSHDGYRNNGVAGYGDDEDNKSGRIQIAFKPADNLHGLITAEYTKMGGIGDVMQNIPFAYNSTTGALIHAMPSGINSSAFNLLTKPYLDSTEKQVRGNLVYDIAGIEITALGGYDETAWHHSVDQSSQNGSSDPYQFQENQFPKTWNAELRIASKKAGPFQWQVGGFFFQENSHLVSADATPLSSGYDYYFGFAYGTKTSSEAGYAQASYQLTHQLKLSAGVRYTHDYKAEWGYYGNLTTGVVYAYQSGATSSSRPTFHIGLDDQLTRHNLVYAKFDTGYKAGGFNFGGSSYKPESVKAFEIGSKNRFLGDSLQLNLAAFYNDYANQQVSNYAYLGNGQPVQLTQNAGTSHIYGIESELIYKIPVIGTLNLTANWLHARYTNFLSVADPSDPAASGNVQLAGNTPPQSPTWSLAAGLTHDWDAFGGTLTGRIQTKYQSSSNFSFYNFADTRQAPYTMSDAFLTFRPGDSGWSVTAYVKNLENRTVLSDAEQSQYAAAYAYEFYPPRTYGLRIQYNWK